jgi:hypothetical protein
MWLFTTNIPNIGIPIKVFLSQWVEAANSDEMYQVPRKI